MTPPLRLNGRMDGSNLWQSARASTSFLTSTLGHDWDQSIPGMSWSVREVVAHISEIQLWCASSLSAGKDELSTLELKVVRSSAPERLIETIAACSSLLGHVVDDVAPGQRGWQPDGPADATGFSALGCNELLVHTSDAARGLGLEFEPPEVLTQSVLRRLFPWAPRDTDTWETLLLATGRADLPGLERQDHWHPHPAPLSEWDRDVD